MREINVNLFVTQGDNCNPATTCYFQLNTFNYLHAHICKCYMFCSQDNLIDFHLNIML